VDGGGYPDGLVGDAIPFESRLIAIVEALEAMTAARYDRRRGGSALDELDKNRGSQFDPEITDALIDMIMAQELEEVAYDTELTELIKTTRLHDPEWVLSRSAQRKRHLSSTMDGEASGPNVQIADVQSDTGA
jgi:HD-GYP domain-containing protein (c-di-GMP phosphodiesterase class II)